MSNRTHATITLLAFATLIATIVVVACKVENVEAASFNQSCSKDDDCIPVLEIVSDAGNCTQPCSAINKRDEDRYRTAFEEEAHDCTTTAPPACGAHTAACTDGKCVAVVKSGVADAGRD